MRQLQASVAAEPLGAGRMRLRIKSASGEDFGVELAADAAARLASALTPPKVGMPLEPKAPTPTPATAPTPVSAPAPTPAPTPVPAPSASTTPPTAEPPKAPVSVPTPVPVSTPENSAPQDGQKGT